MEHHDLPHVQKIKDNEDSVNMVLSLLEDMLEECHVNGKRSASIIARDTYRCLQTVQQLNNELLRLRDTKL